MSPDEKLWLNKHPRIRLGIGETWEPFVVKNIDGTLKGYDIDMLKKINRLTGTNIELVAGHWSDIVKKAERGEIDGLAESSVNEERRKYFVFTDSYHTGRYFLASTPEKAAGVRSLSDLAGKRIAMLKGNAWTRKIASSIDNVRMVEADSEEDAFRLVLKDRADFAMVLNHLYVRLRTGFGEAFVPAYFFNSEENLLKSVYSIRKDWPELKSIINKALSTFSEEERDAILLKWVPDITQLDQTPLPDLFLN